MMRRDNVALLSDSSSEIDLQLNPTRNTSTTSGANTVNRRNQSTSSSIRRNRRLRNMADTMLPLPVKLTVIEGILLYVFGFGFEIGFRARGPPNRGFFCSDLSIQLHKEPEIVPISLLVVFIYCCCFIPVLAVELYRLMMFDPGNFYSSYERLRGKAARLGIRVVIFCGWFHVAFMTTWALTATAKFSIGRLRPYFLEACQPNLNVSACYNTDKYFSEHDYECLTENRRLLDEAHLSFFSGHSSLSMSAAVFAVLYLQARLFGRVYSRVAPTLIQVSIISIALFISFSRVVDHNHHPEDVLIGMGVGATVSITIGIFCARLFDNKDDVQKEKDKRIMSNDSLVV